MATLSEIEYNETGTAGNNTQLDAEYFSHLDVKRAKGYHYAVIDLNTAQNGTLEQIYGYFNNNLLASVSETDYEYNSSYKARGIRSLVTEARILNPSNSAEIVARTQTVYDEPTYLVADSGTLSGNLITTWTDPLTDATIPANSRALRGKPTTTRVWDSDNNVWIQSHKQYDQYGNARKAWEVNEGPGSIRFVETQYSADYGFAYPTRVDTPAPDPTNTRGTNQGSSATTTYDFMTGLPLTVTDEFEQTTATEYNDPLLRPTRTFGTNFTAPETQTIYDDSAMTVKVRKQIDAVNWDEATTFMDSLGRTVKTVAKDSQGDVTVETRYDFLGRVQMVSNPYRAGDAVLWNLTEYDELGRVKQTREPVENQNPASPVGNILGVTSYDISTAPGYFGAAVTTTDAAGKKSRSITNALGQLIVVEEPDSAGNLDPLPQSTPQPSPTPTPGGGGGGGGGGQCLIPANCPASNLTGGEYPSYATFYRYNAQGKMVEVRQGVQSRWFKYDSLGRLIRVRQPEQETNSALNLADDYNTSGEWTAGFTYDVLGNVLTATDANGTVITNSYDRANRVITRTYSGEPQGQTTPAVEFFYDGKGLVSQQSPNFAKGKLTRVTSSVSETQYSLFDNFGRLTESKQITDGQSYTTGYVYNLSGALIEETYPSGRVVKNEFEADGDLSRVFGQANAGTTERTYVNSFSYTASGGISQMRLGNGRWETAKFNNRLQVIQLGLGASAADAGTWKVNYEYGELDASGNVDAAKNTGNIARQTLTVPGTNFVQAYRYDSLYRLTEAKETTGADQNWIQTWTYDRYGNRAAFTQNIAGSTNASNPTVDQNTNRFNENQGFVYDKNGNVKEDIDPITSYARQFVFNGDNKQTEVWRNGVRIGRYFYDGEGKRVKKETDTETTIFVYSAGKLVAEYSTQLAPQPSINYTTTDHLGSPRIITDELGQMKARRDFMPFGEELYNGIGARSESLKYGTTADRVRQKFTGYIKDNETSLDFAEARMYENRHGRFTAVDPLLASGKSANPQTFNRFVYVGNNPLNITDRLGLEWWHIYNSNTNTRSIFWSTEKPEAGEGETVSKWENYVYKADDGYWYSLDPKSDQSSRWFTQERAEWDNGAYTNYNGYGNVPVYGTFVLPMISGIKTGNVERAMYGFWGTAATLATAPRTIGGLLKEGAREGLSYFSGLPIFNPFKKPLANEDIVQKAANIAENKIGGIGSVPGTLKHNYASELINRYQRRFGDRGLATETSWMNRREVNYGTKGSVRFDVTDVTNGTAYDFKFTLSKPALTQRRIDQLLENGPRWAKTVQEINPR